LLNFCGVRQDFISFVVDASDYKQGHFLPGSHIPIVDESKILSEKARLHHHPSLEFERRDRRSVILCARLGGTICSADTGAEVLLIAALVATMS
jgi:hypothetical protein